jgi:hypothetical protein
MVVVTTKQRQQPTNGLEIYFWQFRGVFDPMLHACAALFCPLLYSSI